ncbi:MAG TPA: Rieske 2Fe-2S domain-containing protein [Dehalococcoidia bacterium]|nr:Rieske 2Fe-2S domain-containing protein [Dehalococcoidia bacterium]
MLSQTDNEIMCRVGPGTPMGTLMREYWLPALQSSELATPDCPPLRLRLLGENLIAFRTTAGDVGLIQNACPHRGASMFFGRNEEEGLRCVYHGWKFDTTGACVDMPSEPAESNFKNKVRTVAYPCVERNGVIWAYMGPREVAPPLPALEANMMESGDTTIGNVLRDCNWMQALEGDIDTSHLYFLHLGAVSPDRAVPGSFDYYGVKDRTPRYNVIETEFGTSYGAYRPAEADTYYWRIANFLFPFYTMIPTGTLGQVIQVRAWVPLDDEHTMFWGMTVPSSRQFGRNGQTGGERNMSTGRPAGAADAGSTRAGFNYLPNTSDWLGRFRLNQNVDNDYLIDREAQRSGSNYTGIPGILQQDQAVTESMGAIYQRHSEHLGTSDSMIIRTRRRVIEAAKALRDTQTIPPGVDHPDVYRTRTGSVILPRSADWLESTKAARWPQVAIGAPVTNVGV